MTPNEDSLDEAQKRDREEARRLSTEAAAHWEAGRFHEAESFRARVEEIRKREVKWEDEDGDSA